MRLTPTVALAPAILAGLAWSGPSPISGGAPARHRSPEVTTQAAAAPATGFTAEAVKGLTYRNLGPFRAGSWIADIAVPDQPARSHLYTMYVGVRYGGVWKTVNNGTTFTQVFGGETTSSIGALAIAPSDETVVWVGTGDASNVRVSMPGEGVFKSADAGRTWRRMGLEATARIARIVIHPTRPDIVYVAAMGRMWSPNAERGVFKTTDGGRTWAKVLYVNDRTGAIDLVVDRTRPDTLYAATYEVLRRPWRLEDGGPGSGIHKTIDGGRTWTRLDGGLPRTPMGRIGLDLYQRNPAILYAVTENLGRRPPTADEAASDRARGREPSDRPIGGELYRTEDGGRSWRRTNAAGDDVSSKAGYSFNQVRVDQNDPRKVLVNSDSLLSSSDGGATWSGLTWNSRDLFAKAFGDFRALWIDPRDSTRIIVGSDGGVHVSYDGGRTCDHLAGIPGGEFYAVAVDMEDPYRIYGGLQDHDSWRGPVNGWSGRVGPEDWVTVGDNDGMYNQVDPTDSRWVYNTFQWGGHFRADMRSRTRRAIVPSRPAGEPPLRFNWTPPLRLSPHNSQILYTGAQVLLRSLDRGDHWEEASPDLTTNDASKISPPGGPVQYCTITTISESAAKAGVIWVGTDDGNVQVTRNHGATWTDVTARIAAVGGAPASWVTRVTASAFAPGTAYVAKSGLRFDQPEALVFKTTDYGASWRAIRTGLPDQPVNVVVEDTRDPDLLFAGTNAGVWASIDGGGRWVRLQGNMPVVAVTDLVIHPREEDLVAATYGRALWVANIAWLREAKEGAFDGDVHLFAVPASPQPIEGAWGNWELYGDRPLLVPNQEGPVISFFLRRASGEKVTLSIADAEGRVLKTIETSASAGLNQVGWNARDRRGEAVAPDDYLVTLQVGAARAQQRVRIRPRVRG